MYAIEDVYRNRKLVVFVPNHNPTHPYIELVNSPTQKECVSYESP